ncbi:phage tail protein [Pseudomonas donghuensis]|uniref:phage tail protein n=1 Tax=Pseudomonas donghuensis TaxID=1163398 RepID=UPI0020C1FB4D|nr:phage tail protein [Pseudomonas donghuensis]MCP6695845.1 phage tail protein [Pseudomonas donghuensis]
MAWYKAGTVALTIGQSTVIGTGTDFAANARVGDAFRGPDGRWYEVTNIASATVLSIFPAYQSGSTTGATYSITPVNGYPKDLTDQVKQVIQQWGSTLAGLAAVSTEDVVPVAKGGTGGTSQSEGRQGLGLKSAAVADVVGIVSQSGGVSTGAIIERGSNGNGEYIKFADGTLICYGNTVSLTINTPVGGGFQSSGLGDFTFPVPFVGWLRVTPQCIYVSGSSQPWASINRLTLTGCQVLASAFINGVNCTVAYLAVGRWYL